MSQSVIHATGEQIRAARALLRIDQGALARMAKVSVSTIRRLEAGQTAGTGVPEATRREVQRALERAGAEFIEDGVRRHAIRRDRDALYRDLRRIAERSAAMLAGTQAGSDTDLYGDDGLPL